MAGALSMLGSALAYGTAKTLGGIGKNLSGSSSQGGSKRGSSGTPRTGEEQAELIRKIEENFKSGGLSVEQRNNSIQDVLDGKSIYDPSASYNSGSGSVRPPAGVTGGGTSYQSGTKNSYSTMDDYLSSYERQMQAAKDAEEAALRARIDQSVDQLMGQIPEINQQYDDMAKESYKNYMLGKRELGGQLGRLGLSGQGITETTGSGLLTEYQNALTSGEQARAEAERALRSDAENIRATGNVAIAENAASYSQQLAAALMEARQQQLAQQLTQQQLDLENQRYNNEWAQSLSDAEYQKKMQAAQIAAQYGDYSPLADLLGGDASAYKSYVDTLNAPKVSSGGGVKTINPNATAYKVAMAAARNGNRSAEVRAIIEAYTGLPMETALSVYDEMEGGTAYSPPARISAAKQEMLMSWVGNGTEADLAAFDQKTAQAIKAGTLTPEELNSFLIRRNIE